MPSLRPDYETLLFLGIPAQECPLHNSFKVRADNFLLEKTAKDKKKVS